MRYHPAVVEVAIHHVTLFGDIYVGTKLALTTLHALHSSFQRSK